MGVELRNVPGLAPPPGYSHMAIARGATLVFTAGAVPLDATGELVGADDAAAQTDQVVANLLVALSGSGARPEDVVKTTVYVAGGDHDQQLAVCAAFADRGGAEHADGRVAPGIPRAVGRDRGRRRPGWLTRATSPPGRRPYRPASPLRYVALRGLTEGG
jgi:enamine deaminase RidA (YjgF/YER057c/UK114 family)